MAVKSEAEAIRIAKPCLLPIMAAAGLAHLHPKSLPDLTLWEQFQKRLQSQALSPHYAKLLSMGGFDKLARIVTDCFFVAPPDRRPNRPLTWVMAANCLSLLINWRRRFPDDPSAGIQLEWGSSLASVVAAIANPGAWDTARSIDVPRSSWQRDGLLTFVIRLDTDSYYEAIPQQIMMIREILWKDEAFRRTRYVRASSCARLLQKALAFLGGGKQAGPHLNLTRSSTEAAFATTLRFISGSQDDAPQVLQLQCQLFELALMHDFVVIMESSKMKKSMSFTFQEHNGFHVTTNPPLAARGAEMDPKQLLHGVFGAGWFFSTLECEIAAVDIKILYHIEWHTAFYLMWSDKRDQQVHIRPSPKGIPALAAVHVSPLCNTEGCAELSGGIHPDYSMLWFKVLEDVLPRSRARKAYVETLRLLQDLCYHFCAVPKSFLLDKVTLSRNSKDIVGRGGEATLGVFRIA
ncbi:hypothetical protein DL93DRAFT_2177243 [Clavulina sp. PMI_390]|nr:hypothetical protein DL93DRAFT_2177243 [Clavulina sp. PMI_390]